VGNESLVFEDHVRRIADSGRFLSGPISSRSSGHYVFWLRIVLDLFSDVMVSGSERRGVILCTTHPIHREIGRVVWTITPLLVRRH
jgi:hypothetical protein